MQDTEQEQSTLPVRLPWGVYRERQSFPENVHIRTNVRPGEFVMQTLFAEFTVLAEKKINLVLEPPNQDKPLLKLLQRGEDAVFDQLMNTLYCVAENSLPSLLQALFGWYDRQNPMDEAGNCLYRRGNKSKGEKEYLCEKRDLAVDFIYCLVLIEILKQLPYHPGHEEQVNHIISLAFRHFKYREGTQMSKNAQNINIVADLFAEVIGVLAQSRFPAVKKRFMFELKELRNKEQTQASCHGIIALFMGMKFFRVKMHPIEDFQACIQFLHECGSYFLELKEKEKEIKHALAGLFVEILLPVAAVVKNEVNVPVLKLFVEMLYVPTMDLAMKKRHSLALFPLVTCLLCVSQKQFFLNNWSSFLTQCLSKLKDRDLTTARIALESLYRLLWVYMIRIKCESNIVTNSRLQSIVGSLFPKGSRLVMPKDAPLNIFVKIVQFIAQEKLDFAMKEIIFDLLGVGKNTKTYYAPERMCIGLRAFLVIADSLQQKEIEPPMPQTMGMLPSGSTLRSKKTFINKFLTDQTAKNIGLQGYYGHVRKAFDSILRFLDSQVGRPMLLIRSENLNRETDNLLSGERKPKIDLFRTCVAALPRIMPEGMMSHELIDLLSRLTVHMDDELGKLAFQSLQNISVDLPEWRHDVVNGFAHFIQREVTDSFPQLLEQSVRRLVSLLTQWKTSTQIISSKDKVDKVEKIGAHQEKKLGLMALETPNHQGPTAAGLTGPGVPAAARHVPTELEKSRATLHLVESLALVLLCSCKPIIRKLAVIALKEARNLFSCLAIPKDGDMCVLDVMDKSCPVIIEKILTHLPVQEKNAALSSYPIDFQWLADRTSIIWASGNMYNNLLDASQTIAAATSVTTLGDGSVFALTSYDLTTFDPWIQSIAIFMHRDFVSGNCQTAVQLAWCFLYNRLQLLLPQVDPITILSDRSSSLLRSRKTPNEREMHINLWKNYVVMGCCIALRSHSIELRCTSPDPGPSTPDNQERFEAISRPVSPGMTTRELLKSLITYLRCDIAELRETTVFALGHINYLAFKDLLEELVQLIKDAIDRRTEKLKGKKKRDVLRLSLVRIFHYMAEDGIFALCSSDVVSHVTDSLSSTFVEYIDGTRFLLEHEADKEGAILNEIRLYFCKFIHSLIKNTPVVKRQKLLSQDLRAGLCMLFASWCGKLGLPLVGAEKNYRHIRKNDQYTDLEISALQACSATLCCGPVYDPSNLNEGGDIYVWLSKLLTTHDEKIYKLVQETIILLLEFNSEAQTLLEWVLDRCYTGLPDVVHGCFNALVVVFNAREYPCDLTSMLNVTLLCCGSQQTSVRHCALQLFRLLYKRFFMDDVVVLQAAADEEEDRHHLKDDLFVGLASWSQQQISSSLASLHPDLTMPIFAEITHRLATAPSAVCENMLGYVTPWLHNIELVDIGSPTNTNAVDSSHSLKSSSFIGYAPGAAKPPLVGSGWGSPEATNMVLNNMMYITMKLASDHPKAIENAWSALVSFWPENLAVIIRYIVIVVGMYPHVFLPSAKKIICFLARAKKDLLIEELVNELRTVEPLTFGVERIETPPFFRLLKRQLATSTSVEGGESDSRNQQQHLNKGQIHTKRHSAEDPSKLPSLASAGEMSAVLSRPCTSSSNLTTVSKVVHEDPQDTVDSSRLKFQPHPLPMPAYGGYYAPLSELLPSTALPNPPYQRCNLAMMLMTDLVLDGLVPLDWSLHLPLMLHVIFLGLDNNRPLIHEHSKRFLLNILLFIAPHNDPFHAARSLISNRCINETSYLFSNKFQSTSGKDSMDDFGESMMSPQHAVPGRRAVDGLIVDTMDPLPDVDAVESVEQATKVLVEFLVTRKCRPLWSYEDITAKVHKIKSAESMEHLLNFVIRIFRGCRPQTHLEQRWAQEAIHMALSCSSRHYAGRSFQIFRSLQVSLSPNDLCDILSRLVETVADQGEDMQGYVTEIMLTLESAVDFLDSDLRNVHKDVCLSTPNLAKPPFSKLNLPIKNVLFSPQKQYQQPQSQQIQQQQLSQLTSALYRSSSCNPTSILARKSIVSSPPIMEYKIQSQLAQEIEATAAASSIGAAVNDSASLSSVASSSSTSSSNPNLLRSRSTVSLKQVSPDAASQDEKLNTLAQMFWITVSLMESDFEYEFLLAIKLLDKVLNFIPPNRSDCLEKLERVLQMLYWHDFPGVHALLLKGLTSPLTLETTWNLLSKLTEFLNIPIVDPSRRDGLAMNIVALLPQLVEDYEDPSKSETEAALRIAEMCRVMHSSGLEHLASVMISYSQKSFKKDCTQWTKCVIKYLFDVYSNLSDTIIAFLVEVLDKGPSSSQGSLLQILLCIIHYVDISVSPSPSINADLLRVIARFVENSHHYKEAQQIIKQCVSRSSTLVAAPPNLNRNSVAEIPRLPHGAFPTPEAKKELPGRTMDFAFDSAQIPIIGSKYWDLQSSGQQLNQSVSAASGTAPLLYPSGTRPVDSSATSRPIQGVGGETGSMSTGASSSEAGVSSSWRRPLASQARTRERLVSLLNCYGPRIIPKSPSVVFDQQSPGGTLERPTSNTPGTSSEEASTVEGMLAGELPIENDGSVERHIQSVFDFLEEPDSCCEYWGVNQRHSLKVNEDEEAGNLEEHKESSDDETQSVSPVDELQADLTAPVVMLRNTLFTESHSISGSNLSIHSAATDVEMGGGDASDLSPSAPSRAETIFSLEEVESSWRLHVQQVINDRCNTSSANTFYLFYRLIQETRTNLANFSSEAVALLYRSNSIKERIPMLSVLESMAMEMDCALVFTDFETLSECKMFEKHRLYLHEMYECYEVYLMRRSQALDLSGMLRTAHAERNDALCFDQKLELINSLYLLHFQLIQLIDCHDKLVSELLHFSRNVRQVQNISHLVSDLRTELKSIQDSEDTEKNFLPNVCSGAASAGRLVLESERDVVENLAGKNYSAALCRARNYCYHVQNANMMPMKLFGPVEAILYLFAKRILTDSRPGYLAVCPSDADSSQFRNQLLEVKIQSSNIHSFNRSLCSPEPRVHRGPDLSYL